MHKRIWQLGLLLAAAATLAVVLFGGLAAAAQSVAQTPPSQASQASPHPIRLAGNVTSVSSASLTLTVKKTTYTINVGTGTWIVVQQNGAAVQGTLSDIVAGKAAVVAGMTTADPTTVDARVVAQGIFSRALGAGLGVPARPAIARSIASGTITAINGSTITLKGAVVPQVIVQTTTDTLVLDNGIATVGTLKVGDSVQVFGRPVKPAASPAQPGTTPTPGSARRLPSSRTIDAWAIHVDSSSSQLMVGRITDIRGNTLTIKTAAGKKTTTITVDSSTGYRKLSKANNTITVASGSLSDVTTGSTVVIEATAGANGNAFTAHAVIVLQNKSKPK